MDNYSGNRFNCSWKTDRADWDRMEGYFLECLEKCGGVVWEACKMCKITIKAYERHREKCPEFYGKVCAVRDYIAYKTESKLLEKVEEGDIKAILYVMRCRGKRLGYVEDKGKVEITGDKFELNVE